MRNRIRFAIAALAIILFAACFFVSCNDEVIVDKSDDYSYTEVLESNGAFEYNEKRYETLQTAIDAVYKNGDTGKITLLGDVKSRPVTVPEGLVLTIDLNGHEIQFYDVEKNDVDKDVEESEVSKGAIILLPGASLVIYNGSVYMVDKDKELVVINANGENDIMLYDIGIAAGTQTVLILADGSSAVMTKTVTVDGTVVAKGGSTLSISNKLPDVRMEGASLIVADNGSAVVKENINDNEYVVSPTGSISDETPEGQKIDPGKIEQCLCYIERESAVLTFGSLEEAFASVEKDDVIKFIGDDTTEEPKELTLAVSASIYYNGFSSKTYNITLADGVTLTINGRPFNSNVKGKVISEFTGTITSAEGGKSSLVLEYIAMNSAIDVSGSVDASECAFKDSVKAGGDVTLEDSLLEKAIEVSGKLTSTGEVVFADAVTAGSIEAIPEKDEEEEKIYRSIFSGDIIADKNVKLTGAEFAELEEGYIDITAGGDVELIGVDGEIGNIATKGDVILLGSENELLQVIGSVTGKDVTATYCSFDSLDDEEDPKSITGSTVNVSDSVFVDTDGVEGYEFFYAIETTGKDGKEVSSLTISSTIGTVGDLNAEAGSISIVNEFEAKKSLDLTTGVITAAGNVELVGLLEVRAPEEPEALEDPEEPVEVFSLTADSLNTAAGVVIEGDVKVSKAITSKTSIFSGTVAAATLDATDVTICGDVNVSGAITSKTSIFSGTIAAASVADEGSTFEKDITAETGNVVLSGSKFDTLKKISFKRDVTASAGNIEMTLVSGIVGDLTAANITIINQVEGKEPAFLESGVITATGDVKLVGLLEVRAPEKPEALEDPEEPVEVFSLTAATLDATDVTICGDVKVSKAITSKTSIFSGTVAAASVADEGSTFEKDITAETGDVTLTGSVFASLAKIEATRDVTATAGSILMTSVTGTVGNLQAGADIKIDNSAATAALVTGDIEAVNAVVVTGNSTYNVTVDGTVGAVSLNATYAAVSDTVALKGDMVSASSVFSGTIAAASVTDTGSTFEKDITAETGVVLSGSKFETLEKTSFKRDVTASAGNIKMTLVSGTVGDLSAKNVTIDNEVVDKKDVLSISTGVIAAEENVTLKGSVVVRKPADPKKLEEVFSLTADSLNTAAGVVIEGDVKVSGAITSKTSIFSGTIAAASVADEGSTFEKDITAETGVVLSGSKFETLEKTSFKRDVTASAGDIRMTLVSGSVGDLSAKNVTIDNTGVTETLVIGAITAESAVSVTGDAKQYVTVSRAVGAASLYAKYANLNEAINISGDMNVTGASFGEKAAITLTGGLTSNASSFLGPIEAAYVIDDAGSSFGGAIVANKGDVKLKGSVFNTEETVAAAGSIVLTRVTGSVGNLEAADDVTISNSQASGTLETGAIKADDAVTVTGKSGIFVTINGAVTGATLNATYATIDGNVVVTGAMKSSGSIFSGTVSADSVDDTGSIFEKSITAETGDVVLSGSIFETLEKTTINRDVTAKAGNIVMTSVTGTVGKLSAGIKVTIANDKSAAGLTTKDITAEDAVSITGNSSYRVTVETVEGSALEAEYAVFKGGITTTSGAVLIEDSVFNTTGAVVSAAGIEMSGVTGSVGALKAEGAVTIANAKATETLGTGVINAKGAVSVTGNADGLVTVGAVEGISLSAASLDALYATFHGGITTTEGAVILTDSHFSEVLGAVTSETGIQMTSVTGSVGAINAKDDVKIINEKDEVLATGAIKAVDSDVDVTGEHVTIGGISGASLEITDATVTEAIDKISGDMSADSATFNGAITVDGKLTSTESYFGKAISAGIIEDSKSTFDADVTATDGDVVLTASVFTGSGDVTASGNIAMTSVTGTAGKLEAEGDVTIANADAATTFTTGAINAGGAVSVISANDDAKIVTVAGISEGGSLTISNAAVTYDVNKISGDVIANNTAFGGAVIADGTLKSAGSDFSDEVTAGVIIDSGSNFYDDVYSKGDLTLTLSTFSNSAPVSADGDILMTSVTGTVGNLTAKADVTIANAEAATTFTTGAINAVGDVSVTGMAVNEKKVTVAGISGASLKITDAKVTGAVDKISVDMTATNAKFEGPVTVDGKLTSTDSIFTGAITAASVDDTRGTFGGSITANSEDITLNDSKFTDDAVTLENPKAVASLFGNIEMTSVTGTVGNLTAKADVTIANAEAATTFTTGAINAVGDVSVTGMAVNEKKVTVAGISGASLKITDAKVTGAVDKISVDITATKATFKADVVAGGDLTSVGSSFEKAVTAGSVTDEDSTFGGAVTTTKGDVELTGSSFSAAGAVTASGDILMTNVSATTAVGALKANSVKIDNAKATEALTTGAITAVDGIAVTGNANYLVTVVGASGPTMDLVYATLDGVVAISGELTSTNSNYAVGAYVTASTVSVTKGIVNGDITAENDISFDSSAFYSTADIVSTNGVIEMSKVSGTAGKLEAKTDVTINNTETSATIKITAIEAGNAVAVTGKANVATKNAIIGDVSATTLNVTDAVVGASAEADDNISIIGKLTSINSEFTEHAKVYANSVEVTAGTISGGITAENGISFDSTAFTSTAEIVSTSGNITLEKVYGNAGVLGANTVTINNAQTNVEFLAQTINASSDVSITGNSKKNVNVSIIHGANLIITNARVSASVELTGELKSTDAIFDGNVEASSVDDTRGTFGGSITAKTGGVTLNDSKLIGSVTLENLKAITSLYGNIEMTKVTGVAGTLSANKVTIDNAQAINSLTTGAISAIGDVEVTGKANASDKTVNVAGITAAKLTVHDAEVSGAVALAEDLESYDSVFDAAVSASAVVDNRSTFGGRISANTGVITLTDSRFTSTAVTEEGEKAVASLCGDILLTKVTGVAGILSGNNVTINNVQATEALATKAIAAVGNVEVKGKANANVKTVTVAGISGADLIINDAKVSDAVNLTGVLTSNDSEFVKDVLATEIGDARSTFGAGITATSGDVTLTSSRFTAGSQTTVASLHGDIEIKGITGAVGALSANNVTINNAQATGYLTTGAITAVGAVDLTGNTTTATTKSVTAASVSGTTLDIDYAKVTEDVSLTGALESDYSEFGGAITATVIGDTGSTFGGNITATAGDITLGNSKFTDAAGARSLYGDIKMTEVTGKAGDLSANTVTISNDTAAPSADKLETGGIDAVGAVKITGNSHNYVTVKGFVYGSKLDADFATFVVQSIFTSTSDVTLTDSVLNESLMGVTATGNIVMTRVSGQTGVLSAKNVTIKNDTATQYADPLMTKDIKAVAVNGAVIVTGNSYNMVQVGGIIKGATLDADYAEMKGSIEMSTSVAADYCILGDGTGTDVVSAETVTIKNGSAMKLSAITADSLTITSPVMYDSAKSTVGTISAKTLSVTADENIFSVTDVYASQAATINGGLYRNFEFSGSTAFTITAGRFTGEFVHKGSAALTITGGFFTSGTGTSTQRLKTGSTTINGTYSLADGEWNLKFENLIIGADATCTIMSGFFEAANASQLNSIGACIDQDGVTTLSTKFVDIAYTGSTIGDSSTSTLNLPGSSKVKRAVIYFYGSNYSTSTSHANYPVVNRSLTFNYPNTVELGGEIMLNNDTYSVISNGRPLKEEGMSSNYDSIVWKRFGSSPSYSYSRLSGTDYSSYWSYEY